MTSQINSEEPAKYKTYKPKKTTSRDDNTIAKAITILESRLIKSDIIMTSPADNINYLRLKLAELEHEVFGVLMLDNRNQLIEAVEMFRGTIAGASVYPREVVKEVLAYNAAAVVFYHNHPSGEPEPSQADLMITGRLKKALALIDVRVLDHIIVGSHSTIAFSERGLI